MPRSNKGMPVSAESFFASAVLPDAPTALIRRKRGFSSSKSSFLNASDLPRLCRYYGTWNRKSAENNPERPWRRSAVLEHGDQTLLTVGQMEALCELLHVPAIQPAGDG